MADNDTTNASEEEPRALDPEPLDPEPLDIEPEDVRKAFPHGENPNPPHVSDVQVPG